MHSEAMTNPTTRALTLLGHLESRTYWSGPELARQLGVTPRTLRRDIDRLRSLGYVVEAESGSGGGYMLGRGQILPPLLLDDEQALIVGLSLMRTASSSDNEQAETALRALATIEGFLPSELKHRLAALKTTTASAKGPPLKTDVLLPCADAIRRNLRISFRYTDRYGKHTDRRVEPHRLVARDKLWILLAFDVDKQDWRTFRIDRMGTPEIGTWQFSPRTDVTEALARLAKPVPITAWKHQVHVHIHAPVDKVRPMLPRFASYLREIDQTTTEFVTGADDPHEAAHWLTTIPFEFTILSDDAVKQAVKSLAKRLANAAN